MIDSNDPSKYNIDSLNKDIDQIISILLDLDDRFLSKKNINDKKIENVMIDLRKKIFQVNFYLHKLELSDSNNDALIKQIKKKHQFMLENYQLINDYSKQVLERDKKKSMDTLTMVNTIFLPLGLITGYFGMNFKSMGSHTHNKGILSFTHGQTLVVTLFLTISLFILYLFHNNVLV